MDAAPNLLSQVSAVDLMSPCAAVALESVACGDTAPFSAVGSDPLLPFAPTRPNERALSAADPDALSLRWRGIIGAVDFALEELAPAVQQRASTWAALELRRRLRPVHSNHGKPVTGVEFESAAWLVEVTIWSSGEADLSTVRLTDDRVVNKHYDLADRKDLDGLLDELVRLLADDEIPPAAFVLQWPGTPS